MSGGVSASGADTFNIGAGATGTLASRSFTIDHNSNGTKSLTVTVNVGNTSTTTFGTPGSLSVPVTLPRIARVPSKPARPTTSEVTSSGFRATLGSAPASNGASIIEYGWQVQNVDTSDTSDHTTSGRTYYTGIRSANTRYRVRVRARNSVGWGSYSDWSTTIRTKVEAPVSATNVQTSRVNDNRVNITWTRRASTAAPVTSQRVQRRAYTVANPVWGSWSNVATVSGTATSFTDTTTQPNTAYQWRIQAVNESGNAVSGGEKDTEIRMTPAAPTGVTAKKLASGDIQVSFKNASPYVPDVRYTIQDNPGGTGWVTVGTRTSDSQPFVHADPNAAVSHQYRVRIEDTRYNLLASAWSGLSNVVQLLAPPLAPTLLAPTGTVDRDKSVRYRWRHNSVDTTDQTQVEIQVWDPRYPNNPGKYFRQTSEEELEDLAAVGVSLTMEWSARTKGAHADFGPWSPRQAFKTASLPEVVIQSPELTLDQSQVEVVWEYQNADASGQSRWEAQLLDAEENVLATGAGNGTASSYRFSYILQDATEYTVMVRARAGSGLWSEWDTTTFTTDFPLPYLAEAMPEWDLETGSVSITFDIDDTSPDELAPDSVDVQRDDGDGWVTIAAGLDPETSMVDYTPRLGEVRYRVISRTDLPTARLGPETVIEWEHGTADPIYVNGGTEFDVVCTAIGHEVSDAPDIEQALQEWAGWPKATAVFGEGESYTVQFQGNIFPHMPEGRSTREEWHDLLLQRGIVCYRDCQGRKVYGLLGLNFSTASSVTRLSVTVDQTEFIEGVPDAAPAPEGDGD